MILIDKDIKKLDKYFELAFAFSLILAITCNLRFLKMKEKHQNCQNWFFSSIFLALVNCFLNEYCRGIWKWNWIHESSARNNKQSWRKYQKSQQLALPLSKITHLWENILHLSCIKTNRISSARTLLWNDAFLS